VFSSDDEDDWCDTKGRNKILKIKNKGNGSYNIEYVSSLVNVSLPRGSIDAFEPSGGFTTTITAMADSMFRLDLKLNSAEAMVSGGLPVNLITRTIMIKGDVPALGAPMYFFSDGTASGGEVGSGRHRVLNKCN
jgi:hypothetical protein